MKLPPKDICNYTVLLIFFVSLRNNSFLLLAAKAITSTNIKIESKRGTGFFFKLKPPVKIFYV